MSNRLECITSCAKCLEPDDQWHETVSGRWKGIGCLMKWSAGLPWRRCVRRRWRRIVEYLGPVTTPVLPSPSVSYPAVAARRLGERLRFGSGDPGYDMHQKAP